MADHTKPHHAAATPSQKFQSSSSLSSSSPSSSLGEAPPDPETLVEIYRTDSEIVAMFVRDEILSPAGIYTALHQRRSGAIVAPASMPGEIGLAVPRDAAAAARARLEVARKDGVLLDGEFVGQDA